MNLLLKVLSIILLYIGFSIPFLPSCEANCLTIVKYSVLEDIYNEEGVISASLVIISVLNLFFLILNKTKASIITNILSIVLTLLSTFFSFSMTRELEEPPLGWLIIVLSNLLFIISYNKKFHKDISFKLRFHCFVLLLVIFYFININFYYDSLKEPESCDLATSHLEYNAKTGTHDCVLNEQNKKNPQ